MNAIQTKKIYLLRHGAIEAVRSKTYIGQLDLPLSQKGIEQANAWRSFFQGNLPETIVCSDLKRCRLTAEIIAGSHGNRISTEKKLREISMGLWEGISMADIQKNFPKAWQNRGKNIGTFRPPMGESFSDLAQRVLPVFYQLCEKSPKDMLIVAHAGVNRVILADMMHLDFNDLLGIPQTYSAGNLIEMTQTKIKILYINQQLPPK